ncbi:unnamed protein product [Rotaria socialis]|uniref:Transposase n=1 Tax=Rotaria socialis TaxID=392032 RepID=A0A821T0R4_9BILA|nr:unnamed protein product [Rotaria socialis]CAF4380600.1 unnamed protein product [Rotaria socialis]CAF4866513.1 unnamed protein product [Rotaria socialis]
MMTAYSTKSDELTVSRTNTEHIAVVQEFLTKFYLQEITFLAHLNSVYSIYDSERVERMASQLRLTFGADHDINHVRALLDFFSDHSRQPQAWHYINIDQHLLKDAGAHHLEPFTIICPECNQYLNINNSNKTMVYISYQRGKILRGIVYSLMCKHQKSNYGKNNVPVMIFPNFIEQGNNKRITAKSLQHGEIVYMGGKYAYERALIEQYTADLVTNANSWMKTVDSLNLQAFNSEQHQEHIGDRRTLARMMYMYNIVQFDLFLGTPHVELPKALDNFDDWVWSAYPRLLTAFIFFWSRHKEVIGSCIGNKCSEALVVDGHQKCRRRVCKIKDIEVQTDLFEKMLVGCCRTPAYKSEYCNLHFYKNAKSSECITQTTERTLPTRSHFSRFKKSRTKKERNFGATNCRTSKERSDAYIRKCARSFGVIAAVTNCGIITTFGEIFRTETLKEILQLLTNCIKASGVIPKTAVYDDGCHLIEYLHNHIGKDLTATPAAKELAKVKFSVDRTHFRNHVGSWCRLNMNPNDNPLNVNTQAAEQLFSWLKGYATIISSLGWRRASMFLLILFHHKNLETTRTKCNAVFSIIDRVPSVPDISLMHTADSISICQQVSNNVSTAIAYSKDPRSVDSQDTSKIPKHTRKRKHDQVIDQQRNEPENLLPSYTKTNWCAQVKTILERNNLKKKKKTTTLET